jgi:hypothetical protein
MDSGHPPFFPYYLVFGWKIFGKTLLTSHLLMLPWVIVFILGLKKLCKTWIPDYSNWAMVAVIVNPVILGQFSLISPDIILITCFVWILYSRAGEKKGLNMLFMQVLALISLRGLMVVFGFIIFDVIRKKLNKNDIVEHLIILIIPGLYFLFHLYSTQWVFIHQSSPWSESFSFVGFNALFKNVMVFFWRLLDFGNLIVVGIFGYLLMVKKSLIFKEKFWVLYLVLFGIFGLTAILASGLSAHRYLLPLYVCLTLITASVISQALNPIKIKMLFLSIYVVLLSGNFWIYPDNIAQGWDSSLAFVPYFNLHKDAVKFLNENQIKLGDVGSAFPNLREEKYSLLNSGDAKFSKYNLSSDSLILYSNIMNEFSDDELNQLKQNWSVVEKWNSNGVKIILYKKPDK